jgi:amidohydrolase
MNRHPVLVVALLALSGFAGPSRAAISDAAIDAAVRAEMPRVIEWRRDIHRNPELSNREFRTSQKVAEHLKSLGIEVRTGIAHTGVVGVLRGARPGPVVGLRADMDALPVAEQVDLPFKSTATAEYRGEKTGVMHACGHDGHTAILMGAAEVLAKMRGQLRGTVLFIFQPAEEGAPDGERGGAPLMIEEGLFDAVKPDAVLGLHLFSTQNTGKVGYRAGPLMAASDRFRMVVTGRQTHGARPWGGVDPIVTASQIVLAMQTIVSRQVDITQYPAVLTVGAIKGGIRNNIIPNEVELIGTIRTFDPAVRADIIERLGRTAREVAASAGATATLEIAKDNNPVVVNDPQLTARLLPALERAAGKDNVVQIPYITGSEDFAYYGERVPSFFFSVGSTPVGTDPRTAPSNHSPQFFVDEASLQVALRSMLGLAIDFLQGGPR